MVTRRIWNNFNSPTEQKLFEDLVGEHAQVNGIDTIYIARGSNSESGPDLFFGDDPTKKYTDNYTIEVYVQSVDNFEGGELFSKFGLAVKKQARFMMPFRAWQREVDGVYNRPQEGDLLWLPNFRALFEIKYVDEEFFFYDFGKNAQITEPNSSGPYGFSLVVEKFRYNDEDIHTGIQDIDNTVRSMRYAYNFTMSSGTGTYLLDETVTQSNASATVIGWNLPTGILQLGNINGQFVANTLIVGTSSNAQWTMISADMLNSVNTFSDNQQIENESTSILDFTEENPFGEN